MTCLLDAILEQWSVVQNPNLLGGYPNRDHTLARCWPNESGEKYLRTELARVESQALFKWFIYGQATMQSRCIFLNNCGMFRWPCSFARGFSPYLLEFGSSPPQHFTVVAGFTPRPAMKNRVASFGRLDSKYAIHDVKPFWVRFMEVLKSVPWRFILRSFQLCGQEAWKHLLCNVHWVSHMVVWKQDRTLVIYKLQRLLAIFRPSLTKALAVSFFHVAMST